MQIRITIPASFALFLISACDQADPQGYFPLKQGMQWDYKRSRVSSDQKWPTVDRFSIENIGHTKLTNGERSYTVSVRRTSDGTDYYLSESDDGIKRIAKRTVIEKTPRFDEVARTVMPNPKTLARDQVWNIETAPYVLHTRLAYSVDLGLNRVKMTFEAVDLDATVDVPAGRFEACIKLEGYASMRLFADARVGYVDVPMVQTEWYAPGVGMVKLERKEVIEGIYFVGGTLTLELEQLHN